MADELELDAEATAIWHLLRDADMATEDQLREIWDEHTRTGVEFRTVLYNYGVVTEEQMLFMIADSLGTEFVDLKAVEPEQAAVELVNTQIARMYEILPLRLDGNQLRVAAARPMDFNLVDELGIVLSREIIVCVARPEEVFSALDHFYPEQSSDSMADVLADLATVADDQFDQDNEKDILEGASQTPIVKFVNIMLFQAVKDRASDIHFEPFADEFKIRYRIDGVLYEMSPPPVHLSIPIISRVKVVSGLNIAERRLPQDGRLELRIGGRKVDLRVSTLPTQYGESVVLRILDKSVISLDLDALGMPDDLKERIKWIVHKPNGIFLVTGPTGSGKTTTLYSCLKEINDPGDKLLTAEDPVEYAIDGLMQVPVHEAIGMTFARALKAFLRQDPDRIMVGEIRDLETASMAIQASLTGHLVLSTLHTNDAPSAVTRLTDMGVQPFLITSTFEGVLGQRLVRKVCQYCKTAYDPTDDELAALEITRDDVGDNQFYYGKGCPDCNNTGYKGRTGIYELFVLSNAVRALINRKEPASVLMSQAVSEGMRPLRQDGIANIVNGTTTVEEIVKYT